eukprot:6635432-Prymnesium_polylepis.4
MSKAKLWAVHWFDLAVRACKLLEDGRWCDVRVGVKGVGPDFANATAVIRFPIDESVALVMSCVAELVERNCYGGCAGARQANAENLDLFVGGGGRDHENAAEQPKIDAERSERNNEERLAARGQRRKQCRARRIRESHRRPATGAAPPSVSVRYGRCSGCGHCRRRGRRSHALPTGVWWVGEAPPAAAVAYLDRPVLVQVRLFAPHGVDVDEARLQVVPRRRATPRQVVLQVHDRILRATALEKHRHVVPPVHARLRVWILATRALEAVEQAHLVVSQVNDRAVRSRAFVWDHARDRALALGRSSGEAQHMIGQRRRVRLEGRILTALAQLLDAVRAVPKDGGPTACRCLPGGQSDRLPSHADATLTRCERPGHSLARCERRHV